MGVVFAGRDVKRENYFHDTIKRWHCKWGIANILTPSRCISIDDEYEHDLQARLGVSGPPLAPTEHAASDVESAKV